MLTLGVETIVILLLIMGVVSAFGGYVVAQERQRRAGGGKSAAELRNELNEYKDDVNAHFQTTAGLLHDMTEQYRAVYEHMASGAQNLCDPDTARQQIESLRAGLLPSGAPDVAPAPEAERDEDADEVPATAASPEEAAASDDATADPLPTDAALADPVPTEGPGEPAHAAAGDSDVINDAVATGDIDADKVPSGDDETAEPAAETPQDVEKRA